MPSTREANGSNTRCPNTDAGSTRSGLTGRCARPCVRNLTESLFGTMTMAELAEALIPRHFARIKQDQIVLAVRVAGIEFEQAVMQLAATQPPATGDDSRSSGLMRVTRTLDVSRETRKRRVQAVRIRNDAVHGEALRRADVDRLLQAMREAIDRASESAAPRG